MGQLVQSVGSSKPGWVPYLPPPQGTQERRLLSPWATKRSCEPYCLRGDKGTRRHTERRKKTERVTESNREYIERINQKQQTTTNNNKQQHHHHHHRHRHHRHHRHHHPRTPEDNLCTRKHWQCPIHRCICPRHNFYNRMLERGRADPRMCLCHRPRTPRVYLSRETKNPFHNHGTPLPRTCVQQHRVRTRSRRRCCPCPLRGLPGK